jgi:acetyltransferase
VDPQFGPVLLFGAGGQLVEVHRDTAVALPPLNTTLARRLMERTRIHRALLGVRGRAAVDLAELEQVLVRVAQLVLEQPAILELDINPLLVAPVGVGHGLLALDARIRLLASEGAICPAPRPANRPYPRQYVQPWKLRDGSPVTIRPIRPEDEPLIHAMFARLTPEDIRLRFFAPMKQLTHQAAARMTQIDYDREMALVAEVRRADAEPEILGVVRIAADPDNREAEYAVLVRSDMKGKGLGFRLMHEILEYARERGIGLVHGQVLRENVTMLRLCQDLGFVRRDDPDEPGVVDVEIDPAKMPALDRMAVP